MGINHPLQDVESEHFVARVRSGQLAQNPLDVGGHESRESAGGAENRAQNSGDVGVHDALGQPNPPPGQSWAVPGAKSKRVSEKEEIAMKSTEHGIEESKAVANMYHMRLMALLQEQVRKRGTKGAARVLEIDPKTVAESIRTGRLSRRTRDALERALQEGIGSAAARQRERNEKLEARVDALEEGHGELAKGQDDLGKELRRRMAAVEGSLRRDDGGGTGAGHAGAGPSAEDATDSEDGAAATGRKPPTRPSMRREYPDLATLEPADDDEEIFGKAWTLIGEWRELLDGHPELGGGVGWLTTQERLLEVELALLEDHGLTLPPEKQPLRGLDRNGQITWRRTALSDTRRERKRAEFLNKITLGRWWK